MAITIKNISTSMVSLFVPSIRLNRELIPGRSVPLTQEEYEELTFDPGVMALVNGHYVVFEGIDEGQKVEVQQTPVYSADKIEDMLDKLDITAFAKFIPTATAAEKESVLKLAVDKGITNPGFVALIKKYCDVDIINAINVKHQTEEK